MVMWKSFVELFQKPIPHTWKTEPLEYMRILKRHGFKRESGKWVCGDTVIGVYPYTDHILIEQGSTKWKTKGNFEESLVCLLMIEN